MQNIKTEFEAHSQEIPLTPNTSAFKSITAKISA